MNYHYPNSAVTELKVQMQWFELYLHDRKQNTEIKLVESEVILNHYRNCKKNARATYPNFFTINMVS